MCAAPQREDKTMELTPEEIAALKALAVAAPKLVALIEDDAELADPAKAEDKTGAQMADPKAGEEPPAPAMAAMSGSIAKLSSKVETLDAENKTLKASLAAQAKKTAESEVAADTAGLTLTDEEKKTLVALKMSADQTSQSAYAMTIKGYRAAAMANGGTTEIGVVGAAAKSSAGGAARSKFAALSSKVKELKIDHNASGAMALMREAGIKPSELSAEDWEAWDAANR